MYGTPQRLVTDWWTGGQVIDHTDGHNGQVPDLVGDSTVEITWRIIQEFHSLHRAVDADVGRRMSPIECHPAVLVHVFA